MQEELWNEVTVQGPGKIFNAGDDRQLTVKVLDKTLMGN